MSEYIHKKHNVTVLLYHIVCPAKYRRTVFSAKVEAAIKHPAASREVLTPLFKLLAIASLRTKVRGIDPKRLKTEISRDMPAQITGSLAPAFIDYPRQVEAQVEIPLDIPAQTGTNAGD